MKNKIIWQFLTQNLSKKQASGTKKLIIARLIPS